MQHDAQSCTPCLVHRLVKPFEVVFWTLSNNWQTASPPLRNLLSKSLIVILLPYVKQDQNRYRGIFDPDGGNDGAALLCSYSI